MFHFMNDLCLKILPVCIGGLGGVYIYIYYFFSRPFNGEENGRRKCFIFMNDLCLSVSCRSTVASSFFR